MWTCLRVTKIIGIALFIFVAMPVFAESAPVYDADAMQQEMENGTTDQSQYLPLPPPPEQETSGAFVPPTTPSQPTVSIEQSMASMSPEQRLQRLEQQVNNMQNSDAVTRVESLQTQVQSLRGQIEQLTHQLEQLQNQQKSMYSDLDKRLSQSITNSDKTSASHLAITPSEKNTNSTMEESVATHHQTLENQPSSTIGTTKTLKSDSSKSKTPATMVETLAAKSSIDQPNIAEEQQIYQSAYNLIKAKKYNDAVNKLQTMLKKYPAGQFASNAHYWLGELYGLMGKNDLALNEFNAVVKTYPDSPRVSDAQLKVGLILASQLKWIDAKAALKKVIGKYPGTASSRLASEQLKQIKQAGH